MRLLNLSGAPANAEAPKAASLGSLVEQLADDVFGAGLDPACAPSPAVAKGPAPEPSRVVVPPRPRIVIPHGTTKLLEDLPAEEYHADPCEGPSLSSSIAQKLDKDSPSKAWAAHPKLGAAPRKHSEALTRGSLIHALLLGEEENVEVIRADDFKTKAARGARDAAHAQGRVPVLEEDFDEASKAAGILTKKFAELGVVLSGKFEVTAFWTEISSSGDRVQCRGRWDHLSVDGGVAIDDIKSTPRAHPDVCTKKIEEYGYDIQRAAYVRACEEIYGVCRSQVRYRLLFVEMSAPYDVTPIALSQGFIDLGERRWQRAVDTWARCLREDRWPGYVDRVVTVAPPIWAVRRELERDGDDEGGEAAGEE